MKREEAAIFRREGILFVISAPSGTGKSTLCENLRQTPDFVFSISCTTRQPRRGEVDGEDYLFLDEQQFSAKVAAGEFLEYARVHGCWYGTLRETVLEALSEGTDVLLDIDVQGAKNIRLQEDSRLKSALVDVFIMPPTFAELERRLRKRGTEEEREIEQRLERGREEMKAWKEFKYTILSGSMEEDLTKFRAIMRAERYLSRRLTLHEE
ncbi:guanylate kinase [Methylacidimicrobium tartarophylax]|uniref:Guanylate kinase n=1 Tax=Methylacidimicrobium tartarophylax TaxID=1041768 RepID=A0A5E6MAK9_9BACT|nr:guanylate kinase [Methylacidimicrobium tartarophylax]VVM06258.1 guanylate kinase [Methylacidimicrobium tartarophylax]